MKKLKKKGFAVTELGNYALLIGVFAVTLALLATILSQMKTTPINMGSASRQDANTVNINDATYITFSDVDANGGGALNCANTTVYNATNAANVSADYTVSGCTIKQTGVTLTVANKTGQSVQYMLTFITYNAAYNSTFEGERGMQTFSSWIPTFVIVLAAVVVLGMLGMMAYNRLK